MNARVFLDTNIILYSFDLTSPEKQTRAKELMRTKPVISTQVVNEFINVCIKKKLQTPGHLSAILHALLGITTLQLLQPATIEKALKITSKHQFSYYNSLIIASALEAGAEILYTEDMQHSQKIESLTITNPFL